MATKATAQGAIYQHLTHNGSTTFIVSTVIMKIPATTTIHSDPFSGSSVHYYSCKTGFNQSVKK